LGSASVLTSDQARDQARGHLVNIIGGKDPLEERHRLAQGVTVKDLALAYLEDHAKVHKKSWTEEERRIGRYVLPIRGNHKVADIKRVGCDYPASQDWR
jgi:hypothetical protein